MVVLIVGISLGGYIAYKFLGAKAGLALGGLLGGLISSTATTVSYARRTKSTAESSVPAAIVIMIASAVGVARILVEIAAVAPSFITVAGPPIAVLFLLVTALSAAVWIQGRRRAVEMPPQQNPTELRPALVFALLYALVLLAVAAAKDHFGNSGLFLVAALSGLTDMDAITLSTSQLVGSKVVDPQAGWQIILIAMLANLAFKGATIATLGHPALLKRIAPLYGMVLAAGVLLLLFWPRLA
jgi:uncharacterized membrane protein (DUF4010 family)